MKKWYIVVAIAAVLVLGYVHYKQEYPTMPASHPQPAATAPAQQAPAATQETAAPQAPAAKPEKTPGLIIKDTKVGTGAEAKSGCTVTVHYTGWLTNGTKFDSSRDRNEPFSFTLGAGQVIPGWDKGVVGMKVGGKRKLTIPPELGYGSQDMGTIPPNSTLVFEVELLGVK